MYGVPRGCLAVGIFFLDFDVDVVRVSVRAEDLADSK